MTPEIGICLAILATAMVLFARESLSPDVVAIGILLTLVLTGVLSAERALRGFASETVITILGLLIMTAGLAKTGVVNFAARTIMDRVGDRPLVPAIMITAASLSAFISNTAATAFLMPVVLGLAKRTKTPAAKYLLPLAFASILASSITLVSTSTNLIVNELMSDYGLHRMSMFELAPVGIPIAVLGLLYMRFVGQRLVPVRTSAADETPIGERHYVADVVVRPNAPVVGQTIAKAGLGRHSGLKVLKLMRDGESKASVHGNVKLRDADRLVLAGSRADVLAVKELPGLELKADAEASAAATPTEDVTIVEGVLMPQSPLIGRTLRSVEFKERFGLDVLGIYRAGATLSEKLSAIRLRLGDVLLLQGTREALKSLEKSNLGLFSGVEPPATHSKRGLLAIAIFGGSLIVAATQWVPVAIAVLGGAFLMMATRCLPPEEAYRSVEWKVVIMIAALLSLGAAMEVSGTGRLIAVNMLALLGQPNPLVLLAIFFVLTVVLTQPMSNQAAAVVIVPVAIQTALALGLDPRPFAMMVAVAASCSYLTPLEPACLIVYGSGHYRFMDFFKVGLPLTLIIFVLSLVLVPIVWPLRA